MVTFHCEKTADKDTSFRLLPVTELLLQRKIPGSDIPARLNVRTETRAFENRVLRRVFGPKRDEVTREWRKLHNEELSDLYSLPNIVRVVKSRRMRWAGHVAHMGERRVVHRVLVGKPEGKRPLGRPTRRWEDNTKMDLQEVGGGCVDWME